MKWGWRIVAGAVAVALGTWFLGWTVPLWWGIVVGFVWPRPVLTAALSAAGGWAGVLVWYLVRGAPVGVLGVRLAGAMQLPVSLLVLATLAYPALLAGCAAWGVSLLRARDRIALSTR